MATEVVETQKLGPVAAESRRLGAWGFFVLWGDLGIGLLVLLAGSFLVPALSLPQALGAILVGSVIGVTLLGLTGIVGSQTGLPTMVCLRPALGRGGSYVATAVNVVQLLGWTVFELAIMGHAANAVVRSLTGLDAAWVWILAFGGAVIALGLWGPVAVVREWLTKFALWAVIATTGWLTWRLLRPRRHRGALVRSRGRRPVVLGRRGHRDRHADLVAPARLGLQPLRSAAGAGVLGDHAGLPGRQRVVLHARRADSPGHADQLGAQGVRRGNRAPGRTAPPARAARRRDRRGLGRPVLVRGLRPERLPARLRPSAGRRARRRVGRPGARLRRDPVRGLPPPDRRRVRAALRRPGRRLLPGAARTTRPRRSSEPRGQRGSFPASAGRACSPGPWVSPPTSGSPAGSRRSDSPGCRRSGRPFPASGSRP